MKLLIILGIIILGVLSGVTEKTPLIIKLDRKQTKSFQHISDEELSDSICNIQSQQKKSFSKDKIQSIERCEEKDELVRITEQCYNKNLFYTTDVKLGSSTKKYQLAVDLMTPWTWVKAYNCEFYNREAQIIDQDLGFNSKSQKKYSNCKAGDYSNSFSCLKKNGCKQVPDTCAEIDLKSEGFSMAGKFADAQMKFSSLGKNDEGIQQQRFVMAYGLSGFKNLQGDGILGLGRPGKTDKKTDSFEKLDYSDIEEEMEEEEEAQEDYADDIADAFNKNDVQNFQIKSVEQRTNILRNMEDRYDSISEQVFSMYIADNYEEYSDEDFLPHLQLGGLQNSKYLHDNSHGAMTWLNITSDRYYYWQLPISSINIYKETGDQKFETVKRQRTPFNSVQIDGFEQNAILSLSTTSIVLPKQQTKDFMTNLQDIYGIKCSHKKDYLYHVYCYNLESPFQFNNIYLTIGLGGSGELVLNPKDLVQDCRKDSKGKYECILNIQESLDDRVILGEAALKNYYWVFDMETNTIGFGAAKTKYNEKIWEVIAQQAEEGIEQIIQDVEYDVEFIARFSTIIFLVIISYFAFKNVNCIIGKFEKIFGKADRVRIQPHLPQSDIPLQDNNVENEIYADLRQQQPSQQQQQEKQGNIRDQIKNQFEEFDNQPMDSQREMLDDTNTGFESFDKEMNTERKDLIDLDDLAI